MTSVETTEDLEQQDTTAQDAPMEAPQDDAAASAERERVNAQLLTQAEQASPIVFGLMSMIKDKFAEFKTLDAEYKKIKSQGEIPVVTLLAELKDDSNAAQLVEALTNLRERMNKAEAAARQLLASKGLSNEAAESEVKNKRDEARSAVNKARDLFEMLLSTNPEFETYTPFLESYKTRNTNAGTSGSDSTAEAGEQSRIREWAKANGHTVADRGRISGTVVEAYRKANPTAGVSE